MGQIKHKMGNVGGGVDISHKSKMSGEAGRLLNNMPLLKNNSSGVVGKGMANYIAGDNVGIGMRMGKPHMAPKMLGDLNKDGIMSSYEENRQEVAFGSKGTKKSGGPKKSKGAMAPGDPEEGELQRNENGNIPEVKLDEVTVTGKGKKPKPEKKGVDWSKAPKNNSQARRDWYTKNNLAQDSTTKLKSTVEKPKTEETTVEKSKTKVAKENLKVVKADVKEKQEGRQDTRKSKRISKRANRVQKREDIRAGRQAAKDKGLKGKAKRDAIKTAKAAAKKKQAEANKK